MAFSYEDLQAAHRFSGWKPIEPPSVAAQQEIAEMRERFGDTPTVLRIMEETEGYLVSSCSCGWVSDRWTWVPPSRRDASDELHAAHLAEVYKEWNDCVFAADIAAAALRQAADAWTGDEGFAAWLRQRAEHVLSVGVYDGESWPE